jgi:hypothetical protein
VTFAGAVAPPTYRLSGPPSIARVRRDIGARRRRATSVRTVPEPTTCAHVRAGLAVCAWRGGMCGAPATERLRKCLSPRWSARDKRAQKHHAASCLRRVAAANTSCGAPRPPSFLIDSESTMPATRLLRHAAFVAAALFTAAGTAAAQDAPFGGRQEYCFGGVGPMCAGAPNAGVTRNADGTVTMKASVGSILHDNCCLRFPSGKWCGGPGVNGSGKAEEWNHDGNCVREWDKAWWNTMPSDNRQWTVTFNPNEAADLNWAQGRRAVLKTGTSYDPPETVASRRLAAPPGTPLDVGDQAFCASGRATSVRRLITGQAWINCL